RWLKERDAAHKVIAIRTKLNELAARAAGETVEAAGSPGRKPGGNAKQEPQAQARGPESAKEAKPEEPAIQLPDDHDALKQMFDKELNALRAMQGTDPLVPVEVTSEVVAKVVGDWTGIPVGNMVKDQAAQLLTME